jgi:serine O-acetyltransferase
MNEGVFEKIAADLKQYAVWDRCEPDFAFKARMILLTPGFQFVLARRIQELVYRIPFVGRLVRRIWWWLTCLIFGSEIAIGCEIAGGLYIPHPYGIVVGRCKIGRNVALLQNVTIGHRAGYGTGEPVIGDHVMLSAGSVVLGNVKVGSHATVGANAVVTKDVPERWLAVGVPARNIPPKNSPGTIREVV